MPQLYSAKYATGVFLSNSAGLAVGRLVWGIVVLTFVAACNSKGATPTAPTTTAPVSPTAPTVTVPPAPSGLAVGALVMKDRTAAITWGASTGATEYTVEVGSSPGSSDGGSQSAGSATSFTLRNLRGGRSHVRLKASNSAGTSAASAEVTIVLPELADYVEALLLGSGPLSFSQNTSCPRTGVWSGFTGGTTVRNRVSAQIPAQYRETIRFLLGQVPEATAGRVATTFEVVPEDAPVAADNQMVHVALGTSAELLAACGSVVGTACLGYNSRPFTGGAIRWSTGYYVIPVATFPQPYAHEPGHGILGMCHINADAIGGGERSLMSASITPGNQAFQLTSFDIEALRAVYGSSVALGAGRAQFVAAGVLR
jgi:hypothetical protein